MQQILLAGGIVLVIYTLGLCFQPIGLVLATILAFVGRVFLEIERGSKQGRKVCIEALKELVKSPSKVGTLEYFVVINVIARIIVFILAGGALIAEFVGIDMVLPYLIGTGSSLLLPINLEAASVLTFLVLPAFFGILFLECAGFVPEGAHLFNTAKRHWFVRALFGLGIFILLMLSVALSLFSWWFRAEYMRQPRNEMLLGDLRYATFILIGILFPFVLVAAAWALNIGFIGMISLGLGVIVCVFVGVEFLCTAVIFVLDYPCFFLSRGGLKIRTELPDPTFSFTSARQSLFPGTAPQSNLNLINAPKENNEMNKVNREKNASLIFGGQDGSLALGHFIEAVSEYDPQRVIRSMALLNPIRHTERDLFRGLSVATISPTSEDIEQALKDKRSEKKAKRVLYKRIAEQYINEHVELSGVPSPLICVLDVHDIPFATEMIQMIKKSMPHVFVLIITSLIEQNVQEPAVQAGLRAIQELYDLQEREFGGIELAILISPRSFPATEHGKETQFKFIGRAIMGLLVAPLQWEDNITLVEVLRLLHPFSPFASVLFDSSPLAKGKQHPLYRLVRGIFPRLPENRGFYGDVDNVVSVAEETFQKATATEKTRAIKAIQGNSLGADNVALFSTPMPNTDIRRFGKLVRKINMMLARAFSNTTAVTILGRTTAYPDDLPSPYLLTVTGFYPIRPDAFLPASAIEGSVPLSLPSPQETNRNTVERGQNGHTNAAGSVPLEETRGDGNPTSQNGVNGHKRSASSEKRSSKKDSNSQAQGG